MAKAKIKKKKASVAKEENIILKDEIENKNIINEEIINEKTSLLNQLNNLEEERDRLIKERDSIVLKNKLLEKENLRLIADKQENFKIDPNIQGNDKELVKKYNKIISENAFYKKQVLEMGIEIRKYEEIVSEMYKEVNSVNDIVQEDMKVKDELIEESVRNLEEAKEMLVELKSLKTILEGKVGQEEEKNKSLNRKLNNLQRKYDSLSNSKLGKVTLMMWDKRKQRKEVTT